MHTRLLESGLNGQALAHATTAHNIIAEMNAVAIATWPAYCQSLAKDFVLPQLGSSGQAAMDGALAINDGAEAGGLAA
jgi:hypothetical protein